MQVHTNINAIPSFKNAVVTIGAFDGVHIGHQKVISQLKEEAFAANGESVVVTFNPHPRTVVHAHDMHILSTLNEKIELLQQAAINHVVIIPFRKTRYRDLAVKQSIKTALRRGHSQIQKEDLRI